MSKYYRCNKTLEVVQQCHRNAGKPDTDPFIRIKLTTTGAETQWMNISEDEARQIAEIFHKSANECVIAPY